MRFTSFFFLGLTLVYPDFLLASSWEEGDPSPAPPQHLQNLFLPGQPFPYVAADPTLVFDGKALPPEPDLLPPEAYESSPLPGRPPRPSELEVPDEEKILQVSQQPLEDNAARDIDPEGHYDFPRWNPVPQWYLPPGVQIPPDLWKEDTLTFTFLPAPGDDLGMSVFDFKDRGLALDVDNQRVLQLAPRFTWYLVDGPANPDMPAQLYDLSLEGSFYFKMGERWTGVVGAGPGVYTDFENTSSEAFRVTGKVLVFHEWSPELKIAGGFFYLGREDITSLPAGGVIYTPSEDVRYELFFPRPKIASRIRQDADMESWCYLAGELGGGSWAIERANGMDDVVAYRDYRLIVGYERVRSDEFRWLMEAGYVFNREIEYRSGMGNSSQTPTGMIRGGVAF